MEEDFYITHIIPDELPKEGLRKILFYTKKENNYYFGKGPMPVIQVQMDKF